MAAASRVLGLLVALLLGCAAQAAPGRVSGHVLIGPLCAGPVREGQSCEADYADVEVVLSDARGQRVARARTNAQGRFELSAEQGPYTLAVLSPKVVRCPDVPLRLTQRALALPAVLCDSGRR